MNHFIAPMRKCDSSNHADNQSHSCHSHDPVLFFCLLSMQIHPLLHKAKKKIHCKSQNRNQKAARNRHRSIIRCNTAVDRNAKPAGADEGRNAGKGDCHRDHVPDAGEDHRHRERKLHAKQNLLLCTAHALCRFQNCRIHVGHACISIPHHREQCIDGQCDYCRRIADSGKRDQKAQHRNRGDGI